MISRPAGTLESPPSQASLQDAVGKCLPPAMNRRANINRPYRDEEIIKLVAFLSSRKIHFLRVKTVKDIYGKRI
jgi:hypothetical protein